MSMKLPVKSVVPDHCAEGEAPGVYVILEGGRLLHGTWGKGKLEWKDVTPNEEDYSRQYRSW